MKVDGRRASPYIQKGLYVVGSREPMRVRVGTKHLLSAVYVLVGLKTLAYFISSLFTKPSLWIFHLQDIFRMIFI